MKAHRDGILNSFLTRFYAFGGLSSAFFYLPIFVIYLSGILTPVQVGILISLKGISTLVFEIPTGFFADTISRKRSVQVGLLLTTASLTIILSTRQFIWLAAAQVLFGIAETFQSGADVSWLYDNLKHMGNSSVYEKSNQRLFQAQYATLVLSYSVGGLLFQRSEKLPFLVSAACIAMALFICSTIPEAPYQEEHHESVRLNDTFSVLSTQDKSLWILVGTGSLLMGGFSAIYVFLIPLILEESVSSPVIGVLFSIATLLTLLVTNYSEKIEKRDRFLFWASPMVLSIPCSLCFFFWGSAPVAIMCLILIRVIWGIFDIVYTVEVNRRIENSSVRATMMSVGNSISNGFSAGLTIVFGASLHQIGIPAIMIIIAVVMFATGSAYALLSITPKTGVRKKSSPK